MNKNKDLEKQLKQKLQLGKSVSLSEEEKERMRAFLSSYQGFNPVKEAEVRAKTQTVFSVLSRFAAPAFMVALFFVGGGVVLAERALPGQSFYPLKTTLENFRGQLSVSPESKARWNTTLVERRLSEARSLASNGQLSKEVAASLRDNVDSYSSSIEGNLESLRSQDKGVVALEIDGEYRSTVRVYKNLLSRLADESGELIALLESISDDGDLRGDGDQHIAAMARTMGDSEEMSLMMVMENDQSEVAIVDDGPVEGDMQMMSLSLPDDIDDVEGGGISGEDASGEPEVSIENDTSEVSAMISVDGDTSLTRSQAFNLSMETLESFVSARIARAEAYLKSAKLDKDLRAELEKRIEEAKEAVSSVEASWEAGDEESARSIYRRALKLAEDVRATVRISESVPQSDVLRSLLNDKLELNEKLERSSEKIRDIESKVESRVNETLKKIGI